MACMKTALVHCKSDGIALFMPDVVRERFRPGIHHGGHDGAGRSMRHLEWTFDPDSSDTTYTVDFVYMLREGNSPVRVEHDTHVLGLFSSAEWLQWLWDTGFRARMIEDPYGRQIFVASRESLDSAKI
jgi:hypothetical protein